MLKFLVDTSDLKAIRIEAGLLLTFGKMPGFSRKILTNDRKINRNTGETDAIDDH